MHPYLKGSGDKILLQYVFDMNNVVSTHSKDNQHNKVAQILVDNHVLQMAQDVYVYVYALSLLSHHL